MKCVKVRAILVKIKCILRMRNNWALWPNQFEMAACQCVCQEEDNHAHIHPSPSSVVGHFDSHR